MTHKTHDDGREITVQTLARVEGEGAMRVVVEHGRVTDVQLQIYEPPRFFEAMLRGRAHTEPPDLTSRICGICPVAYEMSACLAVEDACGVTVPDQVRLLRRLLYCGEWLESHALHVYLLHLPDFLGYPGAVEMSADRPAEVERGLRLKKAGNALMSLIGGRAVHPVNVKVGGFYRWPTAGEMSAVRPQLVRALADALETVAMAARLETPDFEQDYEYVALRSDAADYPLESGTFVTSGGNTFPPREFGQWVSEQHVARSHALHASLRGAGPYVVGPLARYSLNHDRLPPAARQAADAAGLGPTCRNPFRSRSAPSSSVRSSSWWPARRPCGSSTRGRRAAPPRSRSRRVRGWDTEPPRRPAACSSTATSWRPTAPCSTPGSCRRPRRTWRASRATCAGSSRPGSTWTTRS
jgi:coenzyme F420-reducing hydrogenase alpha subunit